MSIELPAIPPQPPASAPTTDWARYVDILRLHVSAESAAAVDRQTAQMVLMTAAVTRDADLKQTFLDRQAEWAAEGARVAMVAMLGEIAGDRSPAAVAASVQARIAAGDAILMRQEPTP